jgi:nickel-dependent lactate racemase
VATVFARGSPGAALTARDCREAVRAAVAHAGDASRTLVLPPDATRAHCGAGMLTRALYEETRAAEFCVMPALGTHRPMTPAQIRHMFGPDIPATAFAEHDWRNGVTRLGTVPSDFVHRASGRVLGDVLPGFDIPVEVNRRLVEGGYSAVFSVGQVVPHEVAGMANGVKNVLVGAGGRGTINASHFLGAVCGMERIMGRAENPVRTVLNYAHDTCLGDVNLVYILTVVKVTSAGRPVLCGLFVGDDHAAFLRAAHLSRQVNVHLLDEPQQRVVAWLDPREFHSAWLANKAIYRTRMAVADGGELLVLAPGVRTFGEDATIDRLVRRYGYRGTAATLRAVRGDAELQDNLSAAAHLIHGSSEGRFRIVYATDPALMPHAEIEAAGFYPADVGPLQQRYDPERLKPGRNDRFYFVPSPALGLWASRQAFSHGGEEPAGANT